MRLHRRIWILLAGLTLLLVAADPVHAQLTSARPVVRLNAVVNPRLAVAVSPGTVNFLLPPGPTGGVAIGSSPLLITTAWNVNAGVNNVSLYAYFSVAAAALTNGAGGNIPSSRVAGSINGGAFITFTRNSPFGAARSIRIFRVRIRNNNRIGQRNDTLNLQIDTTALPLPAGTYTGILNIQARAI